MKLKKFKFSVRNEKNTFYHIIEGYNRYDVEEKMKMMFNNVKSISFMGEVR
jgi:hypothetical protein